MEENTPKENLPKSIEVEGSSVEEAIKRALEFLKVSREDVVIKIVCEEKKGLFGMEGAKPAKIKASLKENENNS
jgi:spoIIIJ-associated protein